MAERNYIMSGEFTISATPESYQEIITASEHLLQEKGKSFPRSPGHVQTGWKDPNDGAIIRLARQENNAHGLQVYTLSKNRDTYIYSTFSETVQAVLAQNAALEIEADFMGVPARDLIEIQILGYLATAMPGREAGTDFSNKDNYNK